MPADSNAPNLDYFFKCGSVPADQSEISPPCRSQVISVLNDGVLSATAIMMWPCGSDGQKQATNFGQSLGQRQNRHTQNGSGYELCPISSTEDGGVKVAVGPL